MCVYICIHIYVLIDILHTKQEIEELSGTYRGLPFTVSIYLTLNQSPALREQRGHSIWVLGLEHRAWAELKIPL